MLGPIGSLLNFQREHRKPLFLFVYFHDWCQGSRPSAFETKYLLKVSSPHPLTKLSRAETSSPNQQLDRLVQRLINQKVKIMALTVNTNIASLTAQRNLTGSQSSISRRLLNVCHLVFESTVRRTMLRVLQFLLALKRKSAGLIRVFEMPMTQFHCHKPLKAHWVK